MQPDETAAARSRVPRGAWLAILTVAGLLLGAAAVSWLFASRSSGQPTEATRNLAALALLGVGSTLFCAGLGAYVLTPGFRGGVAARAGYGSHRLVLASTLLVVVLANLGPILFALVRPGDRLCSIPAFLTAALSVTVALLGVTYVRFIRPGVLTADELGLQPTRLPQHVATGLLVGLAVLMASAAIQVTLDRLGVRQTQLQDFRCIREFPLEGFLAVVVAGGVLAPVAEELYFRGFVFRSYLRTQGPVLACLLSSLLWSTLHLNLPALLPILVLGLIFCWAYQRTGSIVPSVVGHGLNNSVAFVILYFGGVP